MEEVQEEVQEGANKFQHATNSTSNNEDTSTENSNEGGSTSIQEDGAKVTKGTEESKQVDIRRNHSEETKESKHVEPESSVQVKVKNEGESTNKEEGSAIREAFEAN